MYFSSEIIKVVYLMFPMMKYFKKKYAVWYIKQYYLRIRVWLYAEHKSTPSKKDLAQLRTNLSHPGLSRHCQQKAWKQKN